MDGVDVLKALRGWSRVPVLVLSARRASEEKVAALDAGADDYITKPFSMDELMARLRAAVRRVEETPRSPTLAGSSPRSTCSRRSGGSPGARGRGRGGRRALTPPVVASSSP